MNKLLLVILFLVTFSAGAVEYYINPLCDTAGDGTTGGCGGATGARTTAPSPSANDVWYLARGSTLYTTEQLTLQSGMTITDYGDTTLALPIISCECGELDSTLFAYNKTGISLTDIEVRRNTDEYYRAPVQMSGAAGGHTLTRVKLRGGYNNLRLLGPIADISVIDCDLADAGDDNIHAFTSGVFVVTGSTFATPSLNTAGGDNLQMNTWTGVVVVANNVMVGAADIKQNIIANSPSADTDRLYVTGNKLSAGRYSINASAPGLIARNFIDGASQRGIHIAPDYANAKFVVQSNIVKGDMTTGALFVADTAAVGVDVTLANNTLFGGFAAGIKISNDVTSGTVVSRNNVISGTGVTGQVGIYCNPHCAQFDDDYSAFHSLDTESDEAMGAHSITVDPQFIGGDNPTTADGFKLKASSPLIGAGYPTSAKYDYANKRLGNPPNIGAYGTSTAGRTSYSTRSTYVAR